MCNLPGVPNHSMHAEIKKCTVEYTAFLKAPLRLGNFRWCSNLGSSWLGGAKAQPHNLPIPQ